MNSPASSADPTRLSRLGSNKVPSCTQPQTMHQRLELRFRTPNPRCLPIFQQKDCVVQPEIPDDEPIRYDFGDQQQVMHDAHRVNVMVDDHGPYVWPNDLQGKPGSVGKSSSNDRNLISGPPEYDGTVYSLNSGARIRQSNADMDFSGVPSKVDSFSSSAYHSPCWQMGPVQVQMQALDTQPGGGQLVAMNSAGTSIGALLSQQHNGGLFGTICPQDTSASLLEYKQFDAATSMAGGSPDFQQHSYFHGRPRPEPENALSSCDLDIEFEQDTDYQRVGSLAHHLNQEMSSVTHVAQPDVFPYSYQNGTSFTFRMWPNSVHNYPLHVQPSVPEFQRHQNLHLNMAMSLMRPIDAAPNKLPSCTPVDKVLGGAGAPGTVTEHPGGDPLATKQAGGRRRGPLAGDARAHAASTRHDGSCWPCKILRYKCDAKVVSGVCGPCKKTRNPWRFGCRRDTLPSLATYLLAASLLDQHQPEELSKIVSTHIQDWYHDSFLPIHLKWAHGSPIEVLVQEFMPNGEHFLYHDQYIFDNGAYKRVKMASLPIGMPEAWLQQWSPKMHSYLDMTLDEPSFPMFPENCFRGSQNEAQRELIHAISKYNDGSAGERKNILRNSLKLLMITKLASYTLYLDEDNKEMVLQRLMNHSTGGYGKFASSRFLNREIKHVVADIHRDLLNSELRHLQEGLQASDKQKECWGPVLVSMLSLAMVTEIMQHLVQCKASSEGAGIDQNYPDYMRRIQEIKERASDEIADMEYVMQFLRDLFGRKYISQDVEKKKGFKPIFKPSDRAILDAPSQSFAEDLEAIIRKFGDFFQARKQLGPPQGSDHPCISRLVAELLLSCKPKAAPTKCNQVA